MNIWRAANPNAEPADEEAAMFRIIQARQDPNIKGQGANKIEMAKSWNKARDAITEKAIAGYDMKSRYTQLASALDQASTGALAPLRTFVQKYAEEFGIPVDENELANAESAKALTSQLMLLARSPKGLYGGLTGNTSDKDIVFLREMQAQLGNTPEANNMIMDYMNYTSDTAIALENHKIDWVSEWYDKYGDDRPPNIDKWQKEQRDFLRENSYQKRLERKYATPPEGVAPDEWDELSLQEKQYFMSVGGNL